jgi:hypothetical protein
MCLRRAPEEYIAGAALDRAAIQIRQGSTQGIHNSNRIQALCRAATAIGCK